ncbi:unnamed protein product [Xylocopa violacea]|uniref:Uncharacterized protein n=1 Tax=Xylocopa violacea TaxID=135666 RepID=A0ABP1MZ76_XYLVO
MVFVADVSRCKLKNSEKPVTSILKNENSLYTQPIKRRPMVYTKPYKKPTPKIESETTYGSSYMKFDCTPRPRINYGKYEKAIADKTGKFDFETMYKLSYQASAGKVRKPFVPKPQLSINGCHDMITIYETSYLNPGYVKTEPFKPYTIKIPCSTSMDYNSVMKESYQKFDVPYDISRPRKRGFWQTKFKTDYSTTNQLSYKHVEPVLKKTRLFYKPIISACIEKDTVYSTSYQPPGYQVSKKNMISE